MLCATPPSTEALRKDFLYSIARNTVDERVSLNIEQHWLYKNTVSLMRDLRGESRWEVLNEEIDVSSQDLERYSALKVKPAAGLLGPQLQQLL